MNYLPHTEEERRKMLQAIGVSSVEDLFAAIPPELRIGELDLPTGLSELDTRELVAELAAANVTWGSRSFLGAGCYRHFIPAAVRYLIGRGEFATSYTPYQPEVSQGNLQQIFEFQTVICELTGLDVANASLYDGPSAVAEAAFLALRKTGRDGIVLSAGLHPEAGEVVRTYGSGPRLAVDELPLEQGSGRTIPPEPSALQNAGCLVVQQPNFYGIMEDVRTLAALAREAGALLVVSQNPMTLGVLASPGELGADIAAGDVQVFGSSMSFGGPSAGYLACRMELLRQMPGRLVGQTVDADGRICYALTLQTREQHIRRAKATSNICSNQALNALAATIYLALLGPGGLRCVGEICLQRAHHLCEALIEIPGVELAFTGPFYHEFVLRLPLSAATFAAKMRTRGLDPGLPLDRFRPDLDRHLLVAVTETNRPQDLAAYHDAAREVLA